MITFFKKHAGGAKTNKNGLSYEKLTDLDDKLTILKNCEDKNSFKIKFNICEKSFIQTRQYGLFKYMKNELNMSIPKAHGCKKPDECYIDHELKNIFIIEKKFQEGPGSVCEKIQTSDFKKWQYSITFPRYNIVYIYCLSDWFKTNCVAELEYLKLKNVPVFWGSSESYKDDMIDFIVNYK